MNREVENGEYGSSSAWAREGGCGLLIVTRHGGTEYGV